MTRPTHPTSLLNITSPLYPAEASHIMKLCKHSSSRRTGESAVVVVQVHKVSNNLYIQGIRHAGEDHDYLIRPPCWWVQVALLPCCHCHLPSQSSRSCIPAYPCPHHFSGFPGCKPLSSHQSKKKKKKLSQVRRAGTGNTNEPGRPGPSPSPSQGQPKAAQA